MVGAEGRLPKRVNADGNSSEKLLCEGALTESAVPGGGLEQIEEHF